VSVSADAVDEVKKDLTSIRQQLRHLFGTEDQLLAELAELAANHFPELVMQYPEFHLNNAIVSLFVVIVVYVSVQGRLRVNNLHYTKNVSVAIDLRIWHLDYIYSLEPVRLEAV